MLLHTDVSQYARTTRTSPVVTTDLYKVPDAVPPIHTVSSHVATDKGPSKFRSIFSDNLQPIATRGKKARGTLLVDSGSSIKRAPLSVSYYNEISGGYIWRGLVRRRGSAGPVLPLWMESMSHLRVSSAGLLARVSSASLSWALCYKACARKWFAT